MLQVTNPVGFVFKLIDGSDIVEVYHPKASFKDQPLEAIVADIRSIADLNRLANETPEYSYYA